MNENDFYSNENRPENENTSTETVNKSSEEKPNGEYRYSYKGNYSAPHSYAHNT